MYTREEYENLINNSPLFTVDKQNIRLYETEKYAFFTLLAEYYRNYIFFGKALDEYGYTLIETAAECLKYYDIERGDFLHFFNKALKRDLGIAKAKKLIDGHRKGIKLSVYDEQMIRKITSLAKSKNLDILDSAVQIKVARFLGISVERVAELICINEGAITLADSVVNDDGDDVAILDFQASPCGTPEDDYILHEELKGLILKIHNVFQSVQDRQKPLLSLLITAEIIKSLEYDVGEIVGLLQGYAFFNSEIVNWYNKHNSLPTAKQIGEMCGVSEQSLSRTYKVFKEKLK